MISLKDKRILITGASSGIGRATSLLFSQLGAELILTGRSEAELQNTSNLCKSPTRYFTADLNEQVQIQNLAANAGVINGWVHCAGKVMPLPVKFIQQKHLTEIMNINFFSAVRLNAELMKNSCYAKNASLVFLSSISTLHPYFGGGPYISSKSALEGYAKTLALELAPKKIRVNVLQPALVKTQIYDLTKSASLSESEFSKYESQYPFGIGEPEDVAQAAAFLISDASRWITGAFIKMDGGLSLGLK